MDFPWSVLEIDPTDDVSSIKRAYARKLKTTRPDDDQKAFELLVQARDFALALATGEGLPSLGNVNEKTSHVTISTETEKNSHAATIDDETEEQESRLHELLSRHPGATDIEIWQKILKETDKLPLLQRPVIEDAIIQQLFSILVSLDREWNQCIANESNKQLTSVRRWLISSGKNLREKWLMFGSVLISFSDLFGWECSDHSIARALVNADYSLYFTGAINSMREYKDLVAIGMPQRIDENGVPIFAESDVKALACPIISHVFKKIEFKRRKGRWPLDFWLDAGIFTPVYLMAFCRIRYGLAWVSTLLLLTIIAFSVPPDLILKHRTIYIWTLWLPLIGARIWMILFGYRLVLAAYCEKITQADNLHLFDPLLRRLYLSLSGAMQRIGYLWGGIFALAELIVLLFLLN